MRYKLTIQLFSFLLIGLSVFSQAINAAPGDLVTAFSSGGFIREIIGGGGKDEILSTAIQTDGKIIAIGKVTYGYQDCGIVRYNADGSIDTSFGKNGKVITLIKPAFQCFDVALQSDGKLVIAGILNADFGIVRFNSNGSLDTSFGNNGRVTTDFNGTDGAYSVVIQADGKIVAVGINQNNSNDDFAVARYNADGSLDASFDGDGKTTTDFIGTADHARAAVIQTDGKIVVAGNSRVTGAFNDFAIVRYNADGSLDTSFDGDGKVYTDVSGWHDHINAIAIQSDGKIVAAGESSTNNFLDFTFARYNPNGSLDASFDNDGCRIISLANFSDRATGVSVQTDGKIIAVGQKSSSLSADNPDSATVRLNSDGSFDTSFDGDGIATGIGGGTASALQPDGKIISAGQLLINGNTPLDSDFILFRYNTNGSLDTSFSQDGKVITNIGSWSSSAYATAIQPDGKIVAVGFATDTPTGNSCCGYYDFAVIRYNANGSLDTSFSNDGKATLPISDGLSDIAYAVAIQPDGKILAAGRSGGGSALARFNSDGSLDTSFGGDGVLTGVDIFINTATDIAVQPDGKILVSGYSTTAGDIPYDFTLLRYNSNGTPDTSFDGDGKVTTDFDNSSDYLLKIRLQPDGKIVGGGYSQNSSDSDFALVRYNSDGSLDNSFSADGKVKTSIINYDYLSDFAIQTDGKIVTTGASVNNPSLPNPLWDISLARYNADGSLDTSFDNDGIKTTDISGYETTTSIFVQPNGKIVVGGGVNSDAILIRYNSNGSIDTSYGNQGYAVFDFFYTDIIQDMAMDSNGNAIIIGESGYLFTVAKVTGDFVSTLKSPFDFDGDGKTDIGIYRPSAGEWWINNSSNNQTFAAAFGSQFDRIVPGDYTGDGKTDMAFWRPSNGFWYILRSEDFTFYGFNFGVSSDVPVAADFDGDGKTDQAVFRRSTAGWYIQKSSGGIDSITFGINVDSPVVADYDGDGKADIAITRISGGTREWWIRRSSDNQVFSLIFGESADQAVPGDYTGDGKADIAFWRPSNGFWYILRSEDFSFYGFPFGINGDRPTPGDFDGDGKFDPAIYRQSNNGWYQLRSTQGFSAITFGASSDIPVHTAFIP